SLEWVASIRASDRLASSAELRPVTNSSGGLRREFPESCVGTDTRFAAAGTGGPAKEENRVGASSHGTASAADSYTAQTVCQENTKFAAKIQGGVKTGQTESQKASGAVSKTCQKEEAAQGEGSKSAPAQKNVEIISRRWSTDSAPLIAVRRCDPLSKPFVYHEPRARTLLMTQRPWPGCAGLKTCARSAAVWRKPWGSRTRSVSSRF